MHFHHDGISIKLKTLVSLTDAQVPSTFWCTLQWGIKYAAHDHHYSVSHQYEKEPPSSRSTPWGACMSTSHKPQASCNFLQSYYTHITVNWFTINNIFCVTYCFDFNDRHKTINCFHHKKLQSPWLKLQTFAQQFLSPFFLIDITFPTKQKAESF